MIDTALKYIKEVLTEYFTNQFDNGEDRILLSNTINPDGSVPNNLDGKVVFFLVNVDEESTLKNNFNRTSNKNGLLKASNPTIHLNLNLLFCSNFTEDSYLEGLAFLSAVIRFFQQNPVLKPSATGHPLHDSKLLFEMVKLDNSELSHLWSAIGSKLMPSVLYKVRLLAFKDETQGQTVPSIIQPSRNVSV